MKSVIPYFLQRMRTPLLLLVTAYAIAILGLVLIPGTDADGQPWRMDFFHAFYFVSYMATTIGFGEIPYAFNDAQRMWTTVAIYLTVIAWFYALGTIIALVQDPAFQRALGHTRFRRSVKQLRTPFFLVCGYGDTGSLLVSAFAERDRRAVVIDIRQSRINELSVTDVPLDVPALCADASLPDTLLSAGLTDPYCLGVLAVTDNDQANLQIAITGKLLNPTLPVVCRVETAATARNMKSFGTDHVVHPFETFAAGLDLALKSLPHYWIYQWLSGVPGMPLQRPEQELPTGRWLLCGYGRLGRAVHQVLRANGVPVTIIDLTDPGPHLDAPYVRGKGTEAVTLQEAEVEQAQVVFAATRNDADNLSILMTARELNPELMIIARQNDRATDRIFAAAKPDITATPSKLVASEMLSLLAAPLLPEFLRLAREQDPAWAAALAPRIEAVSAGSIPDIWTLELTPETSPALAEAVTEGRRITIGMLETNPRARDRRLRVVSLLLARQGKELLLPDADVPLQLGDRLLMCGYERAEPWLYRTLGNPHVLRYVETGEQRPEGWVWQQWRRHRKR